MSERLEYLRGEIEAERISMSELHELQGLADEIDPSDILLLEWAGVPEFSDGPTERHEDGTPHVGDPFTIKLAYSEGGVAILDIWCDCGQSGSFSVDLRDDREGVVWV